MPRRTIGEIDKRPRHRTFLREWRVHRGYTQEQAAEMIGMSRENLSKLERGLVAYNQPFLEAAAEAYSCDPADLLIRNPADPEGIWSLWDQAQPGERRQAIEMFKIIIGGRKAA